MKYLYHFFTLLSAMLIFSGCSDSSTSNKFEPIKVGTWTINSESEATWNGSASLSKGITASATDTTVLTGPDKIGITVETDDERGSSGFIIFFDDSTISKNDYREGDYLPNLNIVSSDSLGFNIYNYGTSTFNQHVQSFFQGTYDCDSDPSNTMLNYSIHPGHDLTAEPDYIYQIDVQGFSSVLDYLVCNEPL